MREIKLLGLVVQPVLAKTNKTACDVHACGGEGEAARVCSATVLHRHALVITTVRPYVPPALVIATVTHFALRAATKRLHAPVMTSTGACTLAIGTLSPSVCPSLGPHCKGDAQMSLEAVAADEVAVIRKHRSCSCNSFAIAGAITSKFAAIFCCRSRHRGTVAEQWISKRSKYLNQGRYLSKR